ncbi:Aso-1 [Dothidotthia symphoricarpi CBS 119687]|uniref:Aso-1 n=1 Tax=Dothidotthia symphoricarpi CBS 119687 TaxID=1392245 RepID=A0A6A6ARP2_9PLEO|nr:Aso-1 [Dothidotthia symphoricarpi CBS 119687]KAF2134216.1 Aso-1 [Dothidotthia symphoricarpi CBS 119687]
MDNRKQGRPEEELFLRYSASAETPTVGPLKIQKRDTASKSPPPRTDSAGSSSQPAFWRPPPMPSFPAPPSSPPTAPLPYPDERLQTLGQGRYTPLSERERIGRTATPPDAGRRRGSNATGPSPTSPDKRARFDANDPNRPTQAGYGGRNADGSIQPSRLAERRGTAPKPLPESPLDSPDSEGLFQRAPQRQGTAGGDASNPFPEYHQQYWPPPNAGPSKQPEVALQIPAPGGVNRLSSTASTSTTRAQRGSPPPPETPIIPPSGGGIEARFAAAGIAGTSTLNSLQAQNMQNAAASQRSQVYANQQPRPIITSPPPQQQQQQPVRRPWTPTEQPGSNPHGPPAVYQGPDQVAATAPPQGPLPQAPLHSSSPAPSSVPPEHPLNHDMGRMNLGEEPPPAYSSITQPPTAQGQAYPNEKGRPQPSAYGVSASDPNQGHPAFANDVRPQQATPSQQTAIVVAPTPVASQFPPQIQTAQPLHTSSPAPGPGPGPASPPPLPEGWIAHLDPSSGQYYYIHLPTQSTQWEFPKGPTPLNLNEPLSPTGTFVNPLTSPSFGKASMASPGFPAQTPGFPGDFGMAPLATPTAAGFTGPPPVAGVDQYKVGPTNGVYFGPYLRYTNMDLERGLWLGSILLVTNTPHPPTIHIHQSADLSPNPRQLKANPIYAHQTWMFYRYDVDLKMDEEHASKWTYAITSHLGCTRFEFLVAGRHETSWRFIAHSGNDFALNVNANERNKLGGVGLMWKDILQKNAECGGFHVQLGLGGQIYADRLWKEIPLLKQWTAMSGKETRKNAQWTAKHEDEVSHAYFHYYTSHFDQPHLREAFAQIPHILALDDHDIFDGFGSYPEYMQFSNMFKNIGRLGIEMYLLFQHHTTLEILRNVSNDIDLFTVTGTGWHFIKYLGPCVTVVGPDCRSERNPHQVMAGPTYQGIFPKVATLPPSIQHCIWMVPVPIVYPRLESVEHLAHSMATGKKAVTGTFNMLGKVTSSVAGVVGAKGVVGDGFNSVKKAIGKSGLMSGVLSPFGEIDLLDELRDLWTHDSKDLERTYLIRTLQGIAHNKSLRITFFSGAVDCCGAGLVHDPARPQDHKTMYQIISSSVVNAPPGNYVLRLLHNNRALYVPQNGHRSNHQPSDTKEDMMEIFTQDVNGQPREYKRLMGRRNYVACVIYDPEIVNGTFGQAVPGHGSGKLSLAVDFMVQNDGGYSAPMKYGPVIVPSLDYGR